MHERKNLRTIMKVIYLVGLAPFWFSQVCQAGQVHFLKQGTLLVFDETASEQLGRPSHAVAASEKFSHLFDSKLIAGASQFLLAGEPVSPWRPGSDAPVGFSLWLQDQAGARRL